jgi:hypothetical protein
MARYDLSSRQWAQANLNSLFDNKRYVGGVMNHIYHDEPRSVFDNLTAKA